MHTDVSAKRSPADRIVACRMPCDRRSTRRRGGSGWPQDEGYLSKAWGVRHNRTVNAADTKDTKVNSRRL